MTQPALKLEVFTTGAPEADTSILGAQEAEKLRESAFEQGYGAGWQDALEHMRNEDALRRIAAEEALQALSFSYTEAHQALLVGFRALTQAMLEQVLPEAARSALPAYLASELDALVARHTHIPLRILCAPAVQPALAQIVAACPFQQIELVPEPSYSEAQVSLCLGEQERVIDLDAVLARLRDIICQHIPQQSQQEARHG